MTKSTRLCAGIAVLAAAILWLVAAPAQSLAAACTAPVTNQVACENTKAGADPSTWQIEGDGDPSIQGFAASMSVNKGDSISFKIKAPNSNYRVDILRLGYYGGDGARIMAQNLAPTGSSSQGPCNTQSNSGLVDCGNWSTSLSWTVPSTAVSGVYIAHLRRLDADAQSHIMFVVRDDASASKVVVQTSDTTWQAYNTYGGNSLYQCTFDCPPGDPATYKAAYKVSYNRPLDTESKNPRSAFFNGGEYPMVRFLEANGYDVSYMSGMDVHRRGQLLLNHDLFISSGHDEYWSATQRTSMENARDAGVNLAFFSGNEGFWRTRWEPSMAGVQDRTLVSYKDTHFPDQEDPVSWTGTWADPRFAAASDNNTPQNSLTGQLFVVNTGTSDLRVPAQFGKLRFWRNTPAATQAANTTMTLAANTLGYEWDVDADNGFRPPGQFRLSSTTVSDLEIFTDYGSTAVQGGTKTHNLTMYRAPSGALVFGAGTVQWSWGLDDMNGGNTTPSQTMRQATVNLFADMGVQPYNLTSGLVAASASTDNTAPTASITSPPAAVNDGATVTLSGTASDSGGLVAGVEVSTDNGATWHPANGTTSWTYSWTAHGHPAARIKVRATDDSGNIGNPGTGVSVNVNCPCSVWSTNFSPPDVIANDTTPTEVGVKFKSDAFGSITGVRFYKVTSNTGTHTGSLWTADGQRLAQATFTSESASGWQTVTFANPVTILPDTTYVASYHSPNGNYAATADYLWPNPAPNPEGGAVRDSAPLHVLKSTSTSSNGVYSYSGVPTFPSNGFRAANYWVDVVYQPIPAAGAVSNVTATAGRGSATVSWNAPTTGGAPQQYTITPYIGATAQTPKVITGAPPATTTVVGNLTPGTTYTFRVQAANPNGAGAQSANSNAVTVLERIAPSAPTGVTAEPATGSARVRWTEPSSDGGSPITGYTVTPYVGATAQTPVEAGASATSAVVNGLTNGTAYTFRVTATNAIGSTASTPSPAVTPQNMLFDLATPPIVDGGDGSAVELGMKFKADTFGLVTGIRFYKAAANTGTHVGTLWTAGGAQLARVTFTGETASGWQSATFSQPVEITAGATYVVSYHAPNGRYSFGARGFDTVVDNGPLHAIANTTSANGVYGYTGTPTFPPDSFGASNYWVDVMFQPTPAPGQVTGVTATAGRASASVSWNAPASGGGPTSYVVTPYIGGTAQTPKTVSSSPLPTSTTVSGLTPGTAYTFSVRAANANGQGAESAASSPVTPLAPIAPAAPTAVTAEPASSSARVRWTEPSSDGGSAITSYTVTPYIGATAQTPVQVDAGSTNTIVDGLANGTAYTFRVTATNAIGSTQSAASSPVSPARTLFDFAAPATADGGDGSSVELGVKFRPDLDGTITGLRFFKAAANTGTHVGTLWSAGGSQLARATFTSESASGWQTVAFASPVEVTANTTYVASYHAPNGHYSATGQAFATAFVNAPVRALADSTSENGVYGYNGTPTFPNNSWNATNYWVDVLFLPTAVPGAPTDVTATAGTASATVSWTPPSNGGPVTSYQVTPFIGAAAQTTKTVTGTPLATSTTVGGLTPGTAYTFRVRAVNANGPGAQSSASNSVTPSGAVAPGAPTGVTVEPASNRVRVRWAAPGSDGGSAITGYRLTPYIGAAAQAPVTVAATESSTVITGLTNGTAYTFRVGATNANGTTDSAASAAATPRQTLYDLGTPAIVDANDGSSIELGVKFRSDVAGQITGVRFYKAAANTGTHVGTLWSAGGSQLGRATFSGESASGWQTALFAIPVDIIPGTTYVASYHTPNGHYSVTGQGFATAVDNPPLHALADATSANGLYAYHGTPTFPQDSFNATNYWVDVLFAPAPAVSSSASTECATCC